jgi:hypothetical protein
MPAKLSWTAGATRPTRTFGRVGPPFCGDDLVPTYVEEKDESLCGCTVPADAAPLENDKTSTNTSNGIHWHIHTRWLLKENVSRMTRGSRAGLVSSSLTEEKKKEVMARPGGRNRHHLLLEQQQ